MSSKRVYWIEGDGIGPEIWRAARPVIDAALAKESDMRIEWVELLAGEKATAETGSPPARGDHERPCAPPISP